MSQNLISDFATNATCTEVLCTSIDFSSITHQLRSEHSSPSHGISDASPHLTDLFRRIHRASVSGSRSVARIARSRGHTPTVTDRPGSPNHLGPAESPSIVMGSPDRRSTGSLSLARDLSSGSPDHEENAQTVPDRSKFSDHTDPAGSLSMLLDASMIDTLSTGESRGAIIPAVSTAVDPPRVSAEDVRTTLATIYYLWDREITFSSQKDTIHALQQSYREEVARGYRLQEQIDSLHISTAPFVSSAQRRYDLI